MRQYKSFIIGLIVTFLFTLLPFNAYGGNEPWKTPPIPNGWSHVTGTWNTGYVIKDSHGNEFVWIPVGAVNAPGGIAALTSYDWGYGIASCQVQYEPIPSQITNAIAATGGFYVSRYEASNNGGKAQSKPNQSPWNNISWFDSKTQSENMASNYGWTGVYSHLLYDKEWDVICKWLENSGANVTDSTNWGNYANDPYTGNNDLMNTGARSEFCKNNIYDLAGNSWEWTMDVYSGDRLVHGGCYGGFGSDNPASYRYYTADKNYFIGFRSAFVVLNSAPSVALTSPEQGADFSKRATVNLQWSATDPDNDPIAGYELRIGAQQGSNDLGFYNGPNTSYSLNTSEMSGPYPKTIYWAVRTKDDKEAWSSWEEGTFKVTASNIATLSNLVFSEGTLTPDFQSGVLNYSASVPFATDTVNITPTVSDSNATIKINGEAVVTGQPTSVNLSVGNNKFEILVTAQDGTNKAYTLTVVRASNASPIITLNSDFKNMYSEANEYNQIQINGAVVDADNDDVTIYLQIKKDTKVINEQEQIIQKCGEGKEFSFSFYIDDTVAEGEYTIDLWANDGK